MSNFTEIAKPYAQAAFESALENNVLEKWQTFLKKAAYLIGQGDIKRLLNDPRIDVTLALDCFFDLLKAEMDKQGKNLLCLLAEYKRLEELPSIAVIFSALLAEHNKTVTVHVHTALALTAAEKQMLSAALEKRLSRQIDLDCDIDENLLAGAVIRMGDSVVDGSLRGRLSRLKDDLIDG